MPTETVLICLCLRGSAASKWAEARRWRNISRRKEDQERRGQVICLAGKAESGSNVHLFWQTETTGPTHSGTGPSAEIRVKREVEESSGMCAHGVCLRVRALPQVSKAWIKSFSSLHHTSVFLKQENGIDWVSLGTSVNPVVSGSGKWKEINRLRRVNCAWSDLWNWLFFFLSPAFLARSWTWRKWELSGTELYKRHQKKWECVHGAAFRAPRYSSQLFMKWNFKHTPFETTFSHNV